MERGKEGVIPLDKKTMEEIGKQILNHCDFKSIELQERIDKALEYVNQHFISDEGVICLKTGKYVCHANYEFLEEIESILKGEDK